MYGLAEARRIVDNVQKGLAIVVSTHVAFLGFILISTIFVAVRLVLLPLFDGALLDNLDLVLNNTQTWSARADTKSKSLKGSHHS